MENDDGVLPPGCARSFVFEKFLSAGGQAHVYLARQVDLDRLVAIKVLQPELLVDDEAVERFQLEARLTAKLAHPNIVVALDSGFEPEGAWIAYEYLPGQSLESHLHQGPMPVAAALSLARDVLAGLGHAHAAGVLHRDVKPANVIESADRRWKLADFGIARFTGEQAVRTATGMVVGTPHYLAPERVRGEPATASSDLYAVAIMLYRALAGGLPFQETQVARILEWHLAVTPPGVRAKRPEVPVEVEAALFKALAKDPAARFQSAQQMARALGVAEVSSSDTEVLPPTRASAVIPPPRAPAGGSSRLYAVLSALTALLLGITFALRPAGPPRVDASASAVPAVASKLDVALLESKMDAIGKTFWARTETRESMKRYLEVGGFPAAATSSAVLDLPGGRGFTQRFEEPAIRAMIEIDRRDVAAMDALAAPLDDRLRAGDADLETALFAIHVGRETVVGLQVSEYLANVLEASKTNTGQHEVLGIQRTAEQLPLPGRVVNMYERGLAGLDRAAVLLAQGRVDAAALARLGKALGDLEKQHDFRTRYVTLAPEHAARVERLEARSTRNLAELAAAGANAGPSPAGDAAMLARAARAAALVGKLGRFSRDGRLAVAETISAVGALAVRFPEAGPGLRAYAESLQVKAKK